MLSSIDHQAKVTGAVNTLSLESDGWKGYNTDGIGLSRAIKQAFGRAITEFDVLVLGAGGAAQKPPSLNVYLRNVKTWQYSTVHRIGLRSCPEH